MSLRTPGQLRRLTRDTVFMGPEPHFANCKRCGGVEEKPRLPLSMDALDHYLLYVMALHADCEAPTS